MFKLSKVTSTRIRTIAYGAKLVLKMQGRVVRA